MKKIELIFFIVGLLFLAYLIFETGVGSIWNYLANSGQTILLIFLIWFIIYLINTVVWLLLLKQSDETIPFIKLFRITTIGFALNDLIPFIMIGGDIYKISLLKNYMNYQKAVSSVAQYRIIYSSGHMLFIIFGILLIIVFGALPQILAVPFFVLLLLALALIATLLLAYKKGFFKLILYPFMKIKMLFTLLKKIGLEMTIIEELDKQIASFFSKKKFFIATAVLLEFISRNFMALELYVILVFANQPINYINSYILYIFFTALVNLFFIVPMNVGVREGGLYLLLGNLSMSPDAGIFLALAMRIREFLWFIVGMIFISFDNLRESWNRKKNHAANY